MLAPSSHRSVWILLAVVVLLLLGVSLAPEAREDAGGGAMYQDAFAEAQRLLADGRLEAASERAEEIRKQAEDAKDSGAWTRALTMQAQLRMALGGYETAVTFLRSAAWPEPPMYTALLELYQAQFLVRYLQTYSWEIAQREKVSGSGETIGEDPAGELKTWTRDQILSSIQRAFSRAWAQRKTWKDRPISELPDYFVAGNYPARVRGTLRDSVTYLWAEHLFDSAYWGAEDEESLYRLDLADMLAKEPQAGNEPGLHPVARAASLLADLERWHQRRGAKEAALEARLERIRRLAGHYTQAEDRQLILDSLQTVLDRTAESLSWWSMGLVTLAELTQQGEAPWAAAEARELAARAQAAHPESEGGQRAASLIANLDAPSVSVRSMSLDAADRDSIEVTHRNIERLYFRAYAVDLEQRLQSSMDFALLPRGNEIPSLMAEQSMVAEWTLELPGTPDLRPHRTLAQTPLREAGLYLLVASAREDFARSQNHLQALNFLISDLVVQSDGKELTVRSGSSGAAVANAEVTTYRQDWRQPPRPVDRARTDRNGRARVKALDEGRARTFALVQHGEQRSFLQLPRVYEPPKRQEHRDALLFTDRAVYRPGQELKWKVVAYSDQAKEGRFQVLRGQRLTVILRDPNGEEAGRTEVTSNDYGSASGSFPLPRGRLLGNWTLETSLGGWSAIQVEEYKRPTFEVQIDEAAEPMRLNREAVLRGEARYYFGLPVVAAELNWRVTKEPLYPRWWSWRQEPTRTLAAGRSETDAEGRFELSFTPEADERLASQPGLSYRYRLSVDLTDEGGETRSASRSFRLGFVAVEASLERDWQFLSSGQPASVTVRRRNLEGQPLSGTGQWQLLRLQTPERALLPVELPRLLGPSGAVGPPEEESSERTPFRTPGDSRRARWETSVQPGTEMAAWEDGSEIQAGELQHGADGVATLPLPALEAGAYRLRYRTLDAWGTPYEQQAELVVVQPSQAPLPLALLLLAERDTVQVGDTARFLLHSGLQDQPLEMELFRQGQRVETRQLSAGTQVLEVQVGPEHRGGFSVHLRALRDHQLMQQSARVQVPWEDRKLQLELATFRDRLRPGARETWRVVVRGADEQALGAGSAELLASMYDRSLDLFAEHQPPTVLDRYPSYWSHAQSNDNLGAASAVWNWVRGFADRRPYPQLSPDRLHMIEGLYPGGPGMRRRAMGKAVPQRAPMMEAAEAQPAAVAADEAADSSLVALGYVNGGDGSKEEEPPPPGSPATATSESDTPRSNFAETAFWEPHLLLGEDGSVSFEFEVPDSVTEWKLWMRALTRDLRAGSLEAEVRTVKDLLVRPIMPRFLREGDRVELPVLVSNAGERALSGELDLELYDPTNESDRREDFGLLQQRTRGVAFSVEPGQTERLPFTLSVPRGVGEVALSATGRAQGLSDGELRPLPLLPSRLHLQQSRFAAVQEGETRQLSFEDMGTEDPTRVDEQLVVTLDAQLFYSVLSSLPYLSTYPYRCTEQTFQRFLAAGLVSVLYERYPPVADMARQLSSREQRLEPWAGEDANRTMALEETPWLQLSRGGEELPEELANLLRPEIAAAMRAESLAELEQAQTAIGGFPWFPGGPPSPYITLYLLMGFSRALELSLEVPQQMVVRAWQYVHRHFSEELSFESLAEKQRLPLVTMLAYVLSSYPDPSWTGGVFEPDLRTRLLDLAAKHWREQPPLLKGYLALTLLRAERQEEADRVWESVMDSARTTRDEGTFWLPEDRAWLWYRDTVETHAFALRVANELTPEDSRRHGMVQWLLKNKHLNQWKSTRATGEALYALLGYLEQEGALGKREEAQVRIGTREQSFVFEPDRYTGKDRQWVLPAHELQDGEVQPIEVSKEGPGLLFASATWHFSTDRLPESARGDLFSVERRYFRRVHDGKEWTLRPLREGEDLAVGDQLEVQLSLRARAGAEYVHLRDPRGAGFEPETLNSGYRWDLGLARYESIRDSGTSFFIEWLPPGEYTLKHRLRAAHAGTFRVGPATLQSMYAPEFTAYSSGTQLEVEREQE